MKVQLLILSLLFSTVLLNAQDVSILLVDDSDDPFGNTATLGNGFTNNGLGFDLFNAVDSFSGPSIDLMENYDLVVWHTSTDGDLLHLWNEEQIDNGNLELYLEEGGNLWLIGNDFLFSRYGVPPDTFQVGEFVYDYLGIAQYDAQAYGDDNNLGVPLVRPAEGQPISGLDEIFWQFPTLWWADVLSPRQEAVTIYEMGHDNYVFADEPTGIWYDGGNFKTLTFAFDLALANNQDLIDNTVLRVMEFLTPLIVDTESPIVSLAGLRVYPNPTTRNATLNFSLEESAQVAVDIVNMAGQQITTLLQTNTLAAGQHQLEWQVEANLPNGIYQFRIAVNGQTTHQAITVNH